MDFSELASVRWDLLAPVIGIQFILMVIALIDCLRNPQFDRNQRLIWVLVVAFVSFVGPIVYFVWGRRERT